MVGGCATQRRVLRDMLSPAGLEVVEADSGSAGLHLIEQEDATARPFRLILIDRRLPDEDGFAFVECMARARETMVMLLPSDNLHDDTRRCHDLGIAAQLVKPIKQRELWDIVTTMWGSSLPPAAAPPSVARAIEGPRLRIVLAEDNLAGQLIGKQTLEKMGHTVSIANNGREVLRMIETGGIDLVLMDVEMPEMDGLEATRLIRASEQSTRRHLPILAVTAYAMKEDEAKCLAAGADGYVSKPIRPEQLLSAIDRFWSAVRAPSATTPVNLDVALEMVAGDRALLMESVTLFLEKDYPRHRQNLKDSLARNDANGVKRAAHGIKGALDSFGGWLARDVARQLEAIARAGDLAQADQVVLELEAEVGRFADFFDDLAKAEGQDNQSP
jgi:CheY-like chemotaxis protein